MDNPKDLIGKLMYLPGGVKVRVEHIYEYENPVKARTRRVGGPHAELRHSSEKWKLTPCDDQDSEIPKPKMRA
jgi:hypothetical protein